MVVFEVGTRFYFYESPSTIATALQDIHTSDNVSMLERSLENRGHVRICD
jgi:hypothetical protein